MGPIAAGGGGILGAIAGSQPSTSNQNNTAGINQNPITNNGAEQSIFGQSTPGLSSDQQAQVDALNSQYAALGNNVNLGGRGAQIQDQISKIMSSPAGTTQTSPGYLQNQFGNLTNLGNGLQNLANSGANASDVSNALSTNRNLAQMLSDYSANGGLPNSGDINNANNIASNLFASRQTSLNQSFNDQSVSASRLGAQLGRGGADPVLQAKLQTGFLRQQDTLNAQQQGTAQQIALQIPGQRIGYAQQGAGVTNQLANQAFTNQSNIFQNQSYLYGLGNQLGSQARSYRLGTSQTYGNTNNSAGGGWAGAISGALGGAGAGLSAASAFNPGPQPASGGTGGGFFGGGGSGTPGAYSPMSYSEPTQFSSGYGAAQPVLGAGEAGYGF